MVKKIIIAIVSFFGVIVAAYFGALAYANALLAKRSDDVVRSCKKIWISRGLYSSHAEQNSLTAFENAFLAGAIGVEVDVYFDEATRRFVVSHNKPKKAADGTLKYTKKNGRYLYLEEVLRRFGEGHYFWIDFKNLDRLSSEATQAAITRLKTIASHMRDRLYIEGSTPWRLQKYERGGFHTLFAFHPLAKDTMLSGVSANFYKIFYALYGLSAVAVPYGTKNNPKYSLQARRALKGIATFVFHVPEDNGIITDLIQSEEVRVILVGRDRSVNKLHLQNCPEER